MKIPRCKPPQRDRLRQRHIKGAAANLIERIDSPLRRGPRGGARRVVRVLLRELCLRNSTLSTSIFARVLETSSVASTPTAVRNCEASWKARFALSGVVESRSRWAIGLLPDVSDAVIELLADEDPTIREAAAQALQQCSGEDVREGAVEYASRYQRQRTNCGA